MKFLPILLLTSCFCTAQVIKDVYKSELQVKGTAISSYNISVLILHEDGTFELQNQKYSTKKMAKNRIISNLITTTGK